ncbi:CU044_5270 family protein [Actinoplanes sp. NPDC023936]|uniref:CU044_5270 family protein n=1 Tax=Actinoplanes sp. NPDC023936 TaxID=3154910 RepID=UPI00340DDDF6
MNDLDLMARFRDDAGSFDGPARDRARARLMAEAGGLTAGRRAPRPVAGRWGRWLVPAAAFAVLVAGAGAAVVASRSTGPGPSDAQAAEVLRLAAAEARAEPVLAARPDQFVYVESLAAWAGGETTTTGDQIWHAPVAMARRIWLSADGNRDGLLRQKPADPGTEHPMPETAELALPACTEEPVRSCGGTPAYRRDLPTTVEGMRALLYADGADDHTAFGRVADVVREAYVPPTSVSALFEAAATVPGVVRVPEAVDLAGRRGVAVARTEGASRTELIFDAGTYRFLGERMVIDEPAAGDPPAGTVIGFTAQLRVAIVDQAGQEP